jgi:hypothetical protein
MKTCLNQHSSSCPGTSRCSSGLNSVGPLNRVGSGISFGIDSEQLALFRGESAHSEAFRSLRKSLFRSSKRKERAWKKLILQKILLQQTKLTAWHASERNSDLLSLPGNGLEQNSERLLLIFFHGTEFRAFFSSAERFGTEFREFSVPRNSRNSAGTNLLFHLFRLPRNNFFVRNCQP